MSVASRLKPDIHSLWSRVWILCHPIGPEPKTSYPSELLWALVQWDGLKSSHVSKGVDYLFPARGSGVAGVPVLP